MEDSYIVVTRRLEIIDSFKTIVQPFFCGDYKVFLSPGSAQSIGTYNFMTPVEKILTDFTQAEETIEKIFGISFQLFENESIRYEKEVITR